MRASRRRQIGTALILTMALCVDVGADTIPVWTHEFDKEVKSIISLPDGSLLVKSGPNLICLNKITGDIVWKSETLSKVDPIAILDTPVLLLCDHNIRAISRQTGAKIWSSREIGSFSLAGQFYLPEIRALLICAEETGIHWMLMVEIETGALVWENRDFFGDRKPSLFMDSDGRKLINGNQPPLFDSDTTFLTFMNKNHLRKWSAKTGALIWETKLDARQAPALARQYAPLVLSEDGTTVYVPCKKRVQAVRVADGSVLWNKPTSLKGIPMQITELREGILVKGGRQKKASSQAPFITLLNKETGKRVWKRDFTRLNLFSSSNVAMRNDLAYVWSENHIYEIELPTGDYRTLASVKFKGGDTLAVILPTDTGLMMRGRQNILCVGYDGNMLFHTYHQATGPSGWDRFMVGMAQMAGAALGNYLVGAPLLENIGWTAHPQGAYYHTDFSNTKTAPRFTYMVTEKAGPPLQTNDSEHLGSRARRARSNPKQRPGIVKVDLNTGKTVAELTLDDKLPMYDVDAKLSLLFYVVKDRNDKDKSLRTVAAYRF